MTCSQKGQFASVCYVSSLYVSEHNTVGMRLLLPNIDSSFSFCRNLSIAGLFDFYQLPVPPHLVSRFKASYLHRQFFVVLVVHSRCHVRVVNRRIKLIIPASPYRLDCRVTYTQTAT
jgi:hypothetical protein